MTKLKIGSIVSWTTHPGFDTGVVLKMKDQNGGTSIYWFGDKRIGWHTFLDYVKVLVP